MSVKTQYKLLHGDVREQLKKLPDNSVQLVCTSPPYYGLRDYGTATWTGGNDPKCTHMKFGHQKATSTLNGGKGGGAKLESTQYPMGAVCSRCGAKRIDRQIGIEESPEMFIDALVEVFTEVRRVLKPDGLLFINIGDSYCRGSAAGPSRLHGVRGGDKVDRGKASGRGARPFGKIKLKDLVGIPWALAFALRDAGWYLRQDVIWQKVNPLPESVTDRFTKSHEYIFMLSKSPRYYFDQAAVAEPLADAQTGSLRAHAGVTGTPLEALGKAKETKNKRDVWVIGGAGVSDAHYAPYPEEIPEIAVKCGSKPGDIVLDVFVGSGTTGFVALRLGRRFIGIDLNAASLKICEKRFVRAIPSLAWEMY